MIFRVTTIPQLWLHHITRNKSRESNIFVRRNKALKKPRKN